MNHPIGRSVVLGALFLAGCASSEAAPSSDEPTPIEAGRPDASSAPDASPPDASSVADAGPFAFVPVPKNVPSGALCNLPPDYVAKGGDTTKIPCDVAADSLSDRDPKSVPASLKVVAWNVEFGKDSAGVKAALASNPDLAADFVLLSEVARASKTSTPVDIDLAREIATTLKMNYVFAVEWDRRLKPDELGEHGIAILSKYPLGNVTQIRHPRLNDWYGSEQLYGGRITLGADVLVGGKPMRLYASHLCTRGNGGDGRAMQAVDIRADADLPGRPVVQLVGGDLNTWTCNPAVGDCTKAPAAEKTVRDFLAAGWKDGTEGWNGVTQLGKGFFPQRLDWLFYRGGAATPGHRAEVSVSDHKPIFFGIAPPK